MIGIRMGRDSDWVKDAVTALLDTSDMAMPAAGHLQEEHAQDESPSQP
ncbi:MAG: hypothetical protein LLG43_07070 [Deltaproteobacteria bacterium]|nr:hypothetical protein [Deltaproteobacteria bacterium]